MFISLGINDQGKHLEARIIYKGDKYGLNDCLTYDGKGTPLVEFYLLGKDYKQFVSRYYLSTLEGTCDVLPELNTTPATETGLCLCGTMDLSATARQVQTACNAV
jgi:hypothetical protein